MNQRRWQNFKANRRAMFPWLFSVIFVISLLAEIVANDRPLLVYYDGALYTPTLISYPETTFGGEFELEMDYRQDYAKR